MDIADAALKVIAEQGLGRFTAVAIAREVGVSDAALFRHFPTKEAIVLLAIDRVEAILFAGFPPDGADSLERLGAFFRRRVAVIRDHPGVAILIGSDQLAQAAPPEGVTRVVEFRRRSQSFVRRCLVEAHAEGLLADGVGPEEATHLVLGAILSLTRTMTSQRTPSALPERVWALVERSLRPAPPRR
jgi:AcrR family transcriptional regulator